MDRKSDELKILETLLEVLTQLTDQELVRLMDFAEGLSFRSGALHK